MVECNILQCSDTAVSSPNHWCYTDLCLIQLSVMLHSGWWSNIYYTVGGSVLIQQSYTTLIKCSVMLHTVEGGAPVVWSWVKRHCGLCLSLRRAPPPSGRPFTQPHCPKWDSVWLQLDSWQNTLSGHDSLVSPCSWSSSHSW